MTDWRASLRTEIQASTDGFLWAFSQISPSYRINVPPDPDSLGKWSPVRLVWHVTEYERCLVIPSMKQWLGGSIPAQDAWLSDDEEWARNKNQDTEKFIAAFRQTRQEEIDLLDQLVDVDWQTPRKTWWGEKPLSMVVSKILLHTHEHGDTLIRMGTWWESILENRPNDLSKKYYEREWMLRSITDEGFEK
jgi:uncharacterized damage-inducible protein DinB